MREARKRKKLTGEQLGELIGVSKGAISAWEKDRAFPSVENLLALCKVLDVSPDYILTGADSRRISPEMLELLDRLSGLDAAGLEALRRLFGQR